MTALYATLCTSGNGILPDTILRLTPRQIHNIYQHPRDNEGKIIPPREPADEEELSLEEMVGKLHAAASALNLPQEQVAKAERALRKKYGSNP